jgi:hypothetical protein
MLVLVMLLVLHAGAGAAHAHAVHRHSHSAPPPPPSQVVSQLGPVVDTRPETETRIAIEPHLRTRFLRIARRAEYQRPLALAYLHFECSSVFAGEM